MRQVSVIIPVYNVERYIAGTIKSVLDQTYRHFELLLVNDGSTDRSVEICQQFSDSRIRIIHQSNRGVSAARNAGIREAKGEYLAFLDGDDLWMPEKLEKHVQHLDNSPGVGISFSYSAFINELGIPLGIYQTAKTKHITPDYIIRRNPVGNGSTPVIRRDVLEAIAYPYRFTSSPVGEPAYFDPQLHNMEDIECWLRISIQTNWQIEGLPEALTRYRIHSQGHSALISKQLQALDNVIEKTRLYAPKIVERCENPARAYQFRFLSRRAVRLRDSATTAVTLFHRVIKTYWQIFLEEPRRSFLTLAAVYTLWLLPQKLYSQLESFALKTTGTSQENQITKDKMKQVAS